MKQGLRFFSLGLFVAAVLLFLYTTFFEKSDSVMPTERLIESVEAEGYRVVPEEEYIAFTLHQDKNNDTDQEENKKDQAKENKNEKNAEQDTAESNHEDEKDSEEKKDDVKKATFKVTQGVYTPDIADILVEEEIINKSERSKFIKYLDENGYSEKVQQGTFNVSSDMNIKELAETLTTFPGN